MIARFLFLILAIVSSTMARAADLMDTTRISLPPSWSVGVGHSTPRTHYAHIGLFAVAERTHGLQASLLVNSTYQNMRGLQMAVLGSFAGRVMRGVQVGSLFNYAGEASGLQLSALTNIATRGARGLQCSGVSNIAIDGHSGIAQIALSNTTIMTLHGAQVGIANYAGTLRGVQIGVLNIAGGTQLRGLQIGLINASQDTSAFKLGLVNLTPATDIRLLVWAGNTTKTNIGVRFTNGRLYTLFSVGLLYRGFNDKFSGTLNYRAGYRLPIAHRWSLLGDLGFSHIENAYAHESYRVSRMYALQARLSIEWQRWKRIGLFATGGYQHARHYNTSKHFEQKPIIELGLTFHK